MLSPGEGSTALSTDWPVHPHEPLQQLEENLWFLVGSLGPSMPLKRTMAIAKRSDGKLVVHNAIALEESLMKEIEGLGELAYLLVPNGFHRSDAPRFKKRYPQLKVFCPAGSRDRIAEVVALDGTYNDYPKDKDVELQPVDGVGNAEGAMLVHSKAGTTITLTDTIFNMPHIAGFSGFVLKYITASSGGPTVSRVSRFMMIKDKPAFRAWIERTAALPNLRRVLVAHHLPIDSDVPSVLRSIAASL